MDLWRIPDDVMWALKSSAKDGGFMPHTSSTASFLGLLQSRGLLHRSEVAPVWNITQEGRSVLDGARDLTKDDLAAIEVFQRAV